ncbi:hypothetical protein RB594_001890 [Gaeumannomyces avenae]
MSKLILSTGNIVSGGPSIIRKPGACRSNLELTNSLRSNFLAAQEYYGSAAAAEDDPLTRNGNGNGNSSSNGNGSNGHLNGNGTRGSSLGARLAQSYPYIWTEWRKRDGAKDGEQGEEEVLYIPRVEWSTSGLQEEAAQYDITVKLFFLPAGPTGSSGSGSGCNDDDDPLARRQALAAARAGYAREALDLVLRELGGAPSVDLLIVSFPGMSFDGDCEWEADKANAAQGDDDDEAATWRAVADELHTRRGLVRRLGIAEFGSEKLARFLKRVGAGADPAAPRPSVDQINIKNCCNVPPPLLKLARAQGIELLVHSDCTDVLPAGTLRELLGSGPRGVGILINDGDDDEEIAGAPARVRGDIAPQWVVKYTAVVRDRGVIENKGYFAGALFTVKE